jgi:hypothetical protein
MAVQIKLESSPKAALSVAAMCRLLSMSRSQFYWHVKRGTFHAPLYLQSNKRPYYTASMAEDNLLVRQSGIGVNNQYVIFYERQPTGTNAEGKKPKANHSSLVDGLKALGLKTVTPEQVEAAVAACSPNGTSGQDENMILTMVFRHLRRSGVG